MPKKKANKNAKKVLSQSVEFHGRQWLFQCDPSQHFTIDNPSSIVHGYSQVCTECMAIGHAITDAKRFAETATRYLQSLAGLRARHELRAKSRKQGAARTK